MVARISQCDRWQLELALEGRLAEEQAEELSRHLQGCQHCRTELEQLAGNQESWEDMKHLRSTNDSLAAMGDRRTNSSISSAERPMSVTDDENEEHALDFLTPSDNPGMLGRLGGYEIEKVIGRGGMGVVLKAHDLSLNRFVAIKVMVGYLAASAAARKRFAREAQAAAAVVHDHVIPIYAVDTSGRTPFLVMPFVGGRSLQDRLDEKGVLEVKEALRIALQTAQGLAAAHAQGLIHRDIKPANILLENGVERVRITDFGLARASDDASQTQSGFIAGTPQYMAPEQARGEPVDARADLFSLGIVLYAMCTGHPPFRADTTLAVLRRICDDTPRNVCEINADVPFWLSQIIERLLAKSPANRFQTADAVATLLEGWLAHLQQPTVMPRPEWPGVDDTRGQSRTRIRRSSFAIGGIAILTTVVLLVRTYWPAGPLAPGHLNVGSATSSAQASHAASATSNEQAWSETQSVEKTRLLQGTWKIVAGGAADKEIVIGDRVTFSGRSRLTIQKERWQKVIHDSATFSVDTTKAPHTIDITFENGSHLLGLYEVYGDRLKMCFGPAGGQRPAKLGSVETDSVHMFVELERQKW